MVISLVKGKKEHKEISIESASARALQAGSKQCKPTTLSCRFGFVQQHSRARNSGSGPMTEEEKIDPRHSSRRAVLRVLGPALTLLGLVLIIIAMVSFFFSFGTFGAPRYFWCFFAGIPLLFVGLVMSQYGYFGLIFRYIAGEAASVQKDAFNYLADGTSRGCAH
jgi:hypothetical protein